MSNLHAYFVLRNQQGFVRALDGSRSQANTQSSGPVLSSSGGKSWTRPSALSSSQTVDVNGRDWLGRTVLHLACAVTEPFALDYVRLLLAHPNINVNLQDTESRWTALHRALYAGNLAACMLLLQRSDTDTQARDYDGYTPFDLYNFTVDGTRPDAKIAHPLSDELLDVTTDLFTWGANRNAALGHGDADDRTYPDQVVIHQSERPDATSSARFTSVQVKGVSMARLHTMVITDEKRGNLRACGFGSGGRLGPGQHTQYSLLPVPQFTHHVVAVALGQDHTLALTSDGEVLSWGLNRFSQLGYVVEQAAPVGPLHTRAMEEPIQAAARKVLGSLRKELVVGIAACKTASACWTHTDVFTWGTNSGQLGYDRAAQPVQILPRKVTGVQGVKQLVMTDSAMACLLDTKDVVCFRDDARFRIKFPAHEVSELPPYLHPHVGKPAISKLTSCHDVFGALSARGDVFTFSIPPSNPNEARAAVKPQRVWSLRKDFDTAKDIALGSDGEVILCTEAGHVFVRSRHVKAGTSGKSLKFHRVPFIHRAVRVCANSTGAFAALRLNYTPKAVQVSGPSLTDDLREIRPWMRFGRATLAQTMPTLPEDEEETGSLEMDVNTTIRLCALLAAEKESQKSERRGLFRGPGPLPHGADVIIQAGLDIPAHRVILAARSPTLRGLLSGSIPLVKDASITLKYHAKGSARPRITVTGCHSMSILLSLEFLYTDDVPALWDRRVSFPCADILAALKVGHAQVKSELEALARVLDLPELSAALSVSVKRTPSPTMHRDIKRLFVGAMDAPPAAMKPDTILELSDREVSCHSVILRARSQFFRSFFDDEDWTVNRWGSNRMLKVNFQHLHWRAMSFVMTWMCCGEEHLLFDELDSVDSISELLDLVFSVIAAASELLLDKLMLICSSVVLRHVTLTNVSSLLADATYYNALHLVHSLQAYVASNMEAIMESRLLDGVHLDMIKELSSFVRKQQADKFPVVRSNLISETAIHKERAWLELQDIPQPIVRSQRPVKESPKLSPVTMDKTPRYTSRSVPSPLSSPALQPLIKSSPPEAPREDDIFAMEDDAIDSIPVLNIDQPRTHPTGYSLPASAWKLKPTQPPARLNMKTIMAEAESGKTLSEGTTGLRSVDSVAAESAVSGSVKSAHKPSQRERRKVQSHAPDEVHETPRRVLSSMSPWKLPTQQAFTSTSPVPPSVRIPPFPTTNSRTEGAQSSTLGPADAKVLKPQPVTPASIFHGSLPLAAPGPSLAGASRRSSDVQAWARARQPGSSLSPISALSFAAIQEQQRDKEQQPRSKKSLREIQEEERARQEEEEFLRWWTAEEERMKVEAGASLALKTDTGASSGRGHSSRRGRSGGARGKRGDGRGRGDKTGNST